MDRRCSAATPGLRRAEPAEPGAHRGAVEPDPPLCEHGEQRPAPAQDGPHGAHNFQSEFDSLGFKVIARWAGEPIRAVIAVPADSPIQHLHQLEGKRVSFPSTDAFVAYAVPLVALKRAGVRVEQVFGGNQEGTLAQLKARRVEAGAANSRFLNQYAEREHVQFREIYVSEGFPDLAVIAHPRVPAATVERVRRALLGMSSDAAAASILTLAKSKGFEAATDRDYDGVRRIYRLVGQ
ncbi:MAG: hypothetical protein DME10_20955 [Candidatus Rokuibacteriota bacterium]|nr:MAG: hypothetical protein DME10_20955 [Candidatus Rokubacteria bacterium]